MSYFEARKYFHFWLRGARITVSRVVAGHEKVLELLRKVHSCSLAEARCIVFRLQHMIRE